MLNRMEDIITVLKPPKGVFFVSVFCFFICLFVFPANLIFHFDLLWEFLEITEMQQYILNLLSICS